MLRKKKKKAKKATDRSHKQEEAGEADSEYSEEESPKKPKDRIKLARADMDLPRRNLNDKINDMDKEERKRFDEEKPFAKELKQKEVEIMLH